ncbi:very short patch repair endonuclease [Prauserella marina]|nr:very short patch repair endonuclease [Prauserella marina]
MRANRRSETKPEIVLRSALHQHGLRYRERSSAPIRRRGQGPAGHRLHCS